MVSSASENGGATSSLAESVLFQSTSRGVNFTYVGLLPNISSDSNVSNNASHDIQSLQDEEILNMTNFILQGVLGNLLVVLGLFGNTLSIVVLCNRRMRSSTSYYLTSLAVYDNFILVAMLLYFNLLALGNQVSSVMAFHNNYILVTLPIGYPLSLAAQVGSIYTCIAFTVERFIAVCRPLHAANTCTRSRAKKVILVIFLWSLIYNIPRCFHYETVTTWNSDTKQYQVTVEPTDLIKNELFQHMYFIFFQLIFMFLVPFLIILVLNIALLRAINHSRQQRQQMSTTDTREHNLTVMLVAVIVVFLVCQFPTIVDNILVAIVGERRHYEVTEYLLLYSACTFLVTVNSSLNFVLYCLFGKKFRMVLRHILGMPAPSRQKSQYRSSICQSRTNGTKLSHCATYDMEVSLV